MDRSVTPPLGIMYLASVQRKFFPDDEVKILDMRVDRNEGKEICGCNRWRSTPYSVS